MTGGVAIEWDARATPSARATACSSSIRKARLLGRYDKAHLVPYGEYLPMRPILSAIGLSRLAPGDLDFWPGPGPRSFDLPGFGAVGVQICYEIIFSGQVIDRANRPAFLFNPSNDAWFGALGPAAASGAGAAARDRGGHRRRPRHADRHLGGDRSATGGCWRALGLAQGGRDRAARCRAPRPPTPFARGGNILPFLFAGLLLIAAFAHRRFAR